MQTRIWLRIMYARAWVRVKSVYEEPLWLLVNMGFPLFTSTALALLYRSAGLASLSGFAVLGGIMTVFWANVLWGMASQFYWDKQVGIFDIYLVSPASITAILFGMSVGGIVSTAPSAVVTALLGWLLFNPPFAPSWLAVALIFVLTLASLYAVGMLLSSLYLTYGREAEAVSEAISEPVTLLSGLYFPTLGSVSPFPFALQAVISLIPLTIGMDALRRAVFFSEGIVDIYPNIVILTLMTLILILVGSKALRFLEDKGRKDGTLSVRLK